uniref:Uncharacterized protein n=1 Tax=Macaca fascicularis TaxID=9541 RepID=A0A7N9CI67_MACFA
MYFFLFFFFETESPSVTQAGVQWHSLHSLHLCLSSSSDSPCFSLRSSREYRHALPHLANFCIFVEMGFRHVSQAGLEFLASGDPPASASQSAGIAGVSHSARP